jgi:hypothetical protein
MARLIALMHNTAWLGHLNLGISFFAAYAVENVSKGMVDGVPKGKTM